MYEALSSMVAAALKCGSQRQRQSRSPLPREISYSEDNSFAAAHPRQPSTLSDGRLAGNATQNRPISQSMMAPQSMMTPQSMMGAQPIISQPMMISQ